MTSPAHLQLIPKRNPSAPKALHPHFVQFKVFSTHFPADTKERRVDLVRQHCRKAAPISTSN